MATGETKKTRKGDGIYQRGTVWYLDCRIKGQRYVTKLGRGFSRTVAVELANIERTKIYRGEAGIGKKKKDCTFDQAETAFLEWVTTNRKPRTARDYTVCVTQLRQSFAGRRLSTIASFDIERHKSTRVKAKAPVRANREVAVMKNLFNFCLRTGLFEGPNPAQGVKLGKEPKQKLRFLEFDEEDRLMKAAVLPNTTRPNPLLRTFITVGTNCGLRPWAETMTLKWENIDFKRGLLTVESAYAKNGESRTVDLNADAHAALTALYEVRSGPWVFCRKDGTPIKNITNSFRHACKRAKLYKVTPHTLRHTFGSRLVMAGVDLRTVQTLGGWKSLDLVMRYAHLSQSHKKQAVEAISRSNFTTPITTEAKTGEAVRLVSA